MSFKVAGVFAHAASEARLFAYACGNFGKGLAFAGADLTMLFLLTDLLGLSAAAAGTLMLVAVAGDLAFDLLAAKLVLRLRRFGRDYRWVVVVGAVPCGTAFAALYALPVWGVTHWAILAGALLAFRGAYAVIDVPHNALMAQLTSDSRARGRVSGYRLLFSTAASLAVAAVLTPLVQRAGHENAFDTLALIGTIAGALFIVTMILSSVIGRSSAPAALAASRDGIDIPLRDPLVIGMLLIALITGLAMPTFGRMLLYLSTYLLDRPDLARTMLLAMTAGQFAGVLAWTALTGRFDKSPLLAAGHGVSGVGLVLFGICLGRPDVLPICAALIGFGFASVFMLPWGLLADSVDFIALRHKRRMETGLFAGYLVAVKASGAAGSVLIGWSLGWLGYVPAQVQAEPVRLGMAAMGLGVPLAGCIGAMLVLRRFDIGHRRHARAVAALGRRGTL
ncbi:MFS transporter [Sphingomonas xinjiangensis]|uniref:GPH family glycoside/pentoside/hexuronide:cation symporter n=1 Tax=Sphingomonas xinjiangensis TaxID=643568 RepID=A0A840YQK0_9SPHN|nr:MFS transporter [Sphingomonas xinjiangensis]MBB5711022.1 GPH family glycoside/pentoside/hexuronide:cation symporter [Sphingomonas xinjiangensis]